jgi:hydrogenase maturation protease
MRDEGLGVHAIRGLAPRIPPEKALCLEGGTALWRVLPRAEDCTELVVIDALDAGKEPGTICCYEVCRTRLGRGETSLHRVSLETALAHEEMMGNTFRSVMVVGMEPADVSSGTELSPVCEERLKDLLDVVGQLIDGCLEQAGNREGGRRYAGH